MRGRWIPVLTMMFVVAACGGGDADAPAEGAERLSVVATTTQLADFARVVGGDLVDVQGILQPNADAHDFEPAPADLEAMADADVILVNGAGLEAWFDDARAAAGGDAVVVTAVDGLTLRSGSDEHGDEHAAEDEAHAEEEGEHAEDEAHAEEGGEHADEQAAEEEGHDHGEFDPHVWFDPTNVEVIVGHIAEAFAAADPANATAFESNAEAYQGELRQLDSDISAALGTLANPKLVTNHDAFGYYVDRYGLTFVGSVIPGLDSTAEPSAAEIDALVEAIEAEGVKAVFTEASLPASVAEALADEAGVTVVSGDDALYGDSLGPRGSAGATYLGMMRHNTDVIVKYLK